MTVGRVSLFRVAVAAASDPDTGVLVATAATYDLAVSRGSDWDGFELLEGVRAGAFAEQVKDPARVKILWQHDGLDPIGHVTDFTDTSRRLDFAALLDADPMVPNAERARLQMKSGTLTDLSVGFEWQKWVEEVDEAAKTRTIWHEKARLREVSVVTWGAQGEAASVRSVAAEGGSGSVPVMRARRARAQIARQRLAGLHS